MQERKGTKEKIPGMRMRIAPLTLTRLLLRFALLVCLVGCSKELLPYLHVHTCS